MFSRDHRRPYLETWEEREAGSAEASEDTRLLDGEPQEGFMPTMKGVGPAVTPFLSRAPRPRRLEDRAPSLVRSTIAQSVRAKVLYRLSQ